MRKKIKGKSMYKELIKLIKKKKKKKSKFKFDMQIKMILLLVYYLTRSKYINELTDMKSSFKDWTYMQMVFRNKQ